MDNEEDIENGVTRIKKGDQRTSTATFYWQVGKRSGKYY